MVLRTTHTGYICIFYLIKNINNNNSDNGELIFMFFSSS